MTQKPKCNICGVAHWRYEPHDFGDGEKPTPPTGGVFSKILGSVGLTTQTPPARKPRRGRPRIEDIDKTLAATRPWEALGMSRRTWYARKKEKEQKP